MEQDPNCARPICEKTDPLKTYKKIRSQINFDDIDIDSDSGNDSNSTKSSNSSSKKANNNNNNKSYDKSYDSKSNRNESTNGNNDDKSTNTNTKEEDDGYRDCPLSRQGLGYYTWNFLHTTAIYYPDKPTNEEKTMMSQFITAFSHFYPCQICSAHFKKDIKISPPRLDSGKDLSIWFCEMHNKVNKVLGKSIFDCSYENLLRRWKTGYDHCNGGKL